jgi:hypothetical protein
MAYSLKDKDDDDDDDELSVTDLFPQNGQPRSLTFKFCNAYRGAFFRRSQIFYPEKDYSS